MLPKSLPKHNQKSQIGNPDYCTKAVKKIKHRVAGYKLHPKLSSCSYDTACYSVMQFFPLLTTHVLQVVACAVRPGLILFFEYTSHQPQFSIKRQSGCICYLLMFVTDYSFFLFLVGLQHSASEFTTVGL